MSSLAQEESRSISENTTWGKRKQFAEGKTSVGYSAFLGYDKDFEINEEQAKIVRLIYKLLTVKFVGDHANKWKAATDNKYTAETALESAEWKDVISLQNVRDTNTVFWVKAISTADEKPQQDVSVDIQAEGLLVSD